MDEELVEITTRYAERHNVFIRERLGFGIHGSVFAAERKAKPERFAVKFHERFEPYAKRPLNRSRPTKFKIPPKFLK
jgi:hypothetical protein